MITPVLDFDHIDVEKLTAEYSQVTGLQRSIANKVTVQLFKRVDDDQDLIKLLPYTWMIALKVRMFYAWTSAIYRVVMPNTCYNWHYDLAGHNHVPIITNQGCRFVYEDQAHFLEPGKLYRVDSVPHTFCNSGSQPRVHLIFDTYTKGRKLA